MAVNYRDPNITDIPAGSGPTWGDKINDRFDWSQQGIRSLKSDLALLIQWTFGPGRVIASAGEGQPQVASGLALRLTPQSGLPARYVVRGEPFLFKTSEPPFGVLAPPNRTNCYGFLSPDPENSKRLLVRNEDWVDSPSAAVIASKLAEGKPCLGSVTTTGTAITTYDPTPATIIQSLSSIGSRLTEIETRLEVLEGGSGTDGGDGTPGTPGTSGPAYASLLQFERASDDTPGDERKTNVVVRDFLGQAKAYTDEKVATGGTKLVFPPLDQLFDHVAYLYWALGELWPESPQGASVSVVNLNRWGDGTNGSPNFRGPSTGIINPDTLEVDPS